MLNIITIITIVTLCIAMFIIIPLKLDQYKDNPKILPVILTIMFMTIFIILLINYLSFVY